MAWSHPTVAYSGLSSACRATTPQGQARTVTVREEGVTDHTYIHWSRYRDATDRQGNQLLIANNNYSRLHLILLCIYYLLSMQAIAFEYPNIDYPSQLYS